MCVAELGEKYSVCSMRVKGRRLEPQYSMKESNHVRQACAAEPERTAEW